MPLNEADTRAQLIEPKLQAAGWTGSQITREHFYRRDHHYTAGRIYLIGDDARRREPRRVDYLLRYTDAFPIAVVEAKYLSYCFRGAPQIEEQIEQRSRGATRAGVNTTILADLRFPAAPLAEQRRIVEYLDGLQAQAVELKRLQVESAVELERLSGAVLARAFRGEL